MQDIYGKWEDTCFQIVTNKITNWKTHPGVKYMLEHEWVSAAQKHIVDASSSLTNMQIQEIANLNDKIGGAQRLNLFGIITSTSSMRYLKHSIDTLDHAISKNLDNLVIVEVGGGYGGLALVMLKLAEMRNITIKKYIIYDLPHVQKLQQYYLEQHNIKIVEWLDSSTFGEDLPEDDNNVLVSSYCISEIDPQYRKKYLENLLPKCKAAYFRWNDGGKEDLPIDRDERPEIPDTSNGKGNTVIRL